MKCGDVALVDYPFTDATGSKVRPVLVVSADAINARGDYIVVPISSTPPADDPHVFAIRDTDPFFGQTGLKRSSCVKWTKPLPVSRAVIQRRIGSLPAELVAQIQARIRSLFSV
jgi:mRNA interferase MazF